MSRLFGPDFITQKYLRQYPNSERTRSWSGVMVHIQTENGVWRTGGCGYTYAGKPDAWVLPFEEATKKIDHCGPEKMGRFLRADPLKVEETHPLAKFGSPDVVPLGLYRVHWKSGGSSLAAIGMMENGDRWIAPTNWIKPWVMPTAGSWGEIDRLEPIDPTPAPIVEGKVAAFDRIVAAHQTHYDAVAAYNARLTVAEAERSRGSWAIKLDDEYHAMCKAQFDYHRVVREECVAALSATATEGE